MSLAAVLACLWAVAATGVAMLPMRWQYAPGIALLLAAPVLIWLLAAEYGPWAGALAVLAFLSMFRRPLRHVLGKIPVRKREVSK